MKAMIERIENNTINRYGFESRRTIWTFKATERIRKLFKF